MNRQYQQGSELLDYLAARPRPAGSRLPSIRGLADELGISASKLREQLEVARALGLVEVRPKTGIRTLEFSYLPALRLVSLVGLAMEPERFESLRELRAHLEISYWDQAVNLLDPDDLARMESLVAQGWAKLRGAPVQIPHAEHRALHMTVFARLPNDLVRAMLETYWEAYEAVGLGLYADYAYLSEVWSYHERMVKAIRAGDSDLGKRLFVEHTGLLRSRAHPVEQSPAPAHPPGFTGNWKGDLG